MANPGIAPPVLTTNVGLFRLNTDDTVYVALNPPVEGMGDYAHCSDAEIEALLIQSGGSVSRTLGRYFLVLAGQASLKASNIADHDLKVATEERARLLQSVSDGWFALANSEDEAEGLQDIFDSFGFGSNTAHPESSPYPVV